MILLQAFLNDIEFIKETLFISGEENGFSIDNNQHIQKIKAVMADEKRCQPNQICFLPKDTTFFNTEVTTLMENWHKWLSSQHRDFEERFKTVH